MTLQLGGNLNGPWEYGAVIAQITYILLLFFTFVFSAVWLTKDKTIDRRSISGLLSTTLFFFIPVFIFLTQDAVGSGANYQSAIISFILHIICMFVIIMVYINNSTNCGGNQTNADTESKVTLGLGITTIIFGFISHAILIKASGSYGAIKSSFDNL